MNAILRLIRFVRPLSKVQLSGHHELSAAKAKDVTTFHRDAAANVIPSRPVVGFHTGTVLEPSAADVEDFVAGCLGPMLRDRLLELEPVWADPETPMSRQVRGFFVQVTAARESEVKGADHVADGYFLSVLPGASVSCSVCSGSGKRHVSAPRRSVNVWPKRRSESEEFKCRRVVCHRLGSPPFASVHLAVGRMSSREEAQARRRTEVGSMLVPHALDECLIKRPKELM